MIDITTIENELYTPLDNYLSTKVSEGKLAQVPQIWEAGQMMRAPKGQLARPRISYNVSNPYSIDNRSPTKVKNTVDSDEEEFDKDIEYTYLLNPQITISFNGYGSINKSVREAMLLLREWFNIPKLSDRCFGQYEGQVKRSELTEIQDRRAVLETDYEERLGFDAVIEFDDQVKVRESTIETIEIETDDNVESIDT
jgi:hypothetical protein